MKLRLLVAMLLVALFVAGPIPTANAHCIATHVTAYATRYDQRNVDINGHGWVTLCGSSTKSNPDDGWFECWPVHRHHLGLIWWWHSHSSTGARDTGMRGDVYWGWQRHYFPDSNGVKTHCYFETYHGNWAKAVHESSPV